MRNYVYGNKLLSVCYLQNNDPCFAVKKQIKRETGPTVFSSRPEKF